LRMGGILPTKTDLRMFATKWTETAGSGEREEKNVKSRREGEKREVTGE